MAAVAIDHPDSLEDWVAIKDHPFLEKRARKTKLLFHVAWNDVESRVAVTCRRCNDNTDPASPTAWTGAFTFSELRGIHDQLSLVHPSLGQYLPPLPVEPRGLWSYFVHVEPPDESICVEVHRYLTVALEVCGETLLVDTLFEEHSLDEYFEKISELKRRSFDEAVARAEEQLDSVLFLCEGSINMLDMAEVYKQEDEVLFKWNVAWAELYNYLIQPFLDSRELAFNKLREAKAGLENRSLGSRRKAEYQAMFSEWRSEYNHILDSIQELYLQYYERTVTILTASKERMMQHKECFGAKSFESVAFERFVRISEMLSAERLQLLQNRKKHFENQRDKIKQQIAGLDVSSAAVNQQLTSLEHLAYEWQLKIFDSQLDIFTEEEQRVRSAIDNIKQQLTAAAAEVYFYDAVENVEDLASEYVDDEDEKQRQAVNPQLSRLQSRLVVICQRKASVRNRKKALISEKHLKIQKQTENEERTRKHHTIQMKRDEQKAEVLQKREFINSERKKTVERLQQYKLKRAMPRTLRPPVSSSQGGARLRPFSRPRGTVEEQCRGQQRVVSGDVAVIELTDVPCSSSASHHPPSYASRSDLPDGCVNTEPNSVVPSPPPLPTSPPPAPPLPPGPGKLPLPVAPRTSEGHPGTCVGTNAADPVSSPGPSVPLSPPGPAPVLPSVCQPLSLTSDKSRAAASQSAANAETKPAVSFGIDMASIETARLRLKKPARTNMSTTSASQPVITTSELLRQRSNLRPVTRRTDSNDIDDDDASLTMSLPSSTTDEHLRLLREALERIKKSSGTDTDDDDDVDNDDADFVD